MNKKLVASCAVVILGALMTSCLSLDRVDSWLLSKKGSAAINVAGVWDAGPLMGGGWGSANLGQRGDEVFGSIGMYSVTGVVNGENVYLVFLSGSRVYYSAQLSPGKDGSLTGVVVEGALIDTEDARLASKYPITLRKPEPDPR